MRLVDCGLAFAAVAVAGFTVLAFIRGYSWTPFADSWTVLMDYQAAGFRVTPGLLLSFHAEHRPALARVPILIDLLFAGGRGRVPFVLIGLVQFTHAWLLWKVARKLTWYEKRHAALVGALAVFCCFYWSQMEISCGLSKLRSS